MVLHSKHWKMSLLMYQVLFLPKMTILFENNQQMEVNLSTTTSRLVEKIVSLTQQYSVKKIIFHSPQAWGDYFIKDIQKHDSAKFINFMVEEG